MPPIRQVTDRQFELLLEFAERNRNIVVNSSKGALAQREAIRAWEELARRLNSIGGGVFKTPVNWKRYWHLLKCRTKAKAADIRRCKRSQGATDGGLSRTFPLSDLEERLVAVIGKVEGIPQVRIPYDQTPETQLSYSSSTPSQSTASASFEMGLEYMNVEMKSFEYKEVKLEVESSDETGLEYTNMDMEPLECMEVKLEEESSLSEPLPEPSPAPASPEPTSPEVPEPRDLLVVAGCSHETFAAASGSQVSQRSSGPRPLSELVKYQEVNLESSLSEGPPRRPQPPHSFAHAAEYDLVVGITTARNHLGRKKAAEVERLLTMKMIEGSDTEKDGCAMFQGRPIYADGSLKLWCLNVETKNWLKRTLTGCKLSDGQEIFVKEGIELMRRVRCGLLLPGEWHKASVAGKLLRWQNSWAQLDDWLIHRLTVQDKNTFVMVSIPEAIVPAVLERGCKLFFNLGNVYLKFQVGRGRFSERPQAEDEAASVDSEAAIAESTPGRRGEMASTRCFDKLGLAGGQEDVLLEDDDALFTAE